MLWEAISLRSSASFWARGRPAGHSWDRPLQPAPVEEIPIHDRSDEEWPMEADGIQEWPDEEANDWPEEDDY